MKLAVRLLVLLAASLAVACALTPGLDLPTTNNDDGSSGEGAGPGTGSGTGGGSPSGGGGTAGTGGDDAVLTAGAGGLGGSAGGEP